MEMRFGLLDNQDQRLGAKRLDIRLCEGHEENLLLACSEFIKRSCIIPLICHYAYRLGKIVRVIRREVSLELMLETLDRLGEDGTEVFEELRVFGKSDKSALNLVEGLGQCSLVLLIERLVNRMSKLAQKGVLTVVTQLPTDIPLGIHDERLYSCPLFLLYVHLCTRCILKLVT